MSTVKSKKLQVGTDASASNNFTIYQPATPDGTLRIGQGTADNPTEVGRFTSAGYKPQQPVAFAVYTDATQTFVTATNTKVTWQNEYFNTDDCFDLTNNRFKPTVAGYYQLNTTVGIGGAQTGAYYNVNFRKNGSVWQPSGTSTSTGIYVRNVSTTIYLNGSTDYVEVYAIQHSGSTRTITGGTTTTLNGILIAQA